MTPKQRRFIESVLCNDESSSDDQLLQMFMNKLHLNYLVALYYVRQRTLAIGNPDFELHEWWLPSLNTELYKEKPRKLNENMRIARTHELPQKYKHYAYY